MTSSQGHLELPSNIATIIGRNGVLLMPQVFIFNRHSSEFKWANKKG